MTRTGTKYHQKPFPLFPAMEDCRSPSCPDRLLACLFIFWTHPEKRIVSHLPKVAVKILEVTTVSAPKDLPGLLLHVLCVPYRPLSLHLGVLRVLAVNLSLFQRFSASAFRFADPVPRRESGQFFPCPPHSAYSASSVVPSPPFRAFRAFRSSP